MFEIKTVPQYQPNEMFEEYEVSYDPKKKVKIDLLDSLQQAIKNQPAPKGKEFIKMPNFEKVFATDISAFASYFIGFDDMSDEQATSVVAQSFDGVIKFCVSQNHKEIEFIWNLFTNVRYVDLLSKLLSNGMIMYDQQIALNHILYNMYVERNNLKPEVRAAHNRLSRIINSMVIKELSGIDLPGGETTAAEIGMCIYSHTDPIIGIQRLDLYLINSSENVMVFNEEAIVNIFVYLYGTSLTKLVEGVMFDIYTESDMSNLTPTQKDTYYAISLAILDILVQCDSVTMTQVLSSYSQDFFHSNASPNPYKRFSFKYISGDYQRIIAVIQQLEMNGIMVP